MSEAVQEEFVSSIGAVWPPVEASNERIKGFFDQLVEDRYDVDSFVEEYRDYEARMYYGLEAGRLTLRVLANQETLLRFADHCLNIEAALPVKDHPELSVLYIATNHPLRETNRKDTTNHKALLNNVVASKRDLRDPYGHLQELGYVVKRNDPRSEDSGNLTDKFESLYSVFGYDRNDVTNLLRNPSNTILYVEDEKGIASSAMAEHFPVEVNGFGTLNLVEITEAITRDDMRGVGLYRALSGVLTKHLIEADIESPDIDVLYGECNLSMYGVLMAAHQNGRRFSHFDSQELGLSNPNFGILKQNFKVEDGFTNTPYNDFAVSYIELG